MQVGTNQSNEDKNELDHHDFDSAEILELCRVTDHRGIRPTWITRVQYESKLLIQGK